jgi:predicted ATP-grasp superfamily ATP-dependent carboligase
MSGHGRRVLIAENGGALHALAAVRALGAAGWRPSVAVSGPGSRAARSKWTEEVHRVPPPEDDPDAYVDAIAACARSAGYELVLAAEDVEMVALSAGRDRLPCVVPHAPHPALLRAIDKLLLTEAAARAGLGVPETRPATAEHLEELEGPVFVKARLHWRPGLDSDHRHLLARRCANREEAAEYAGAMAAAGREPLLQEPIEGEVIAVTGVYDRDARPVALCQTRTLRLALGRMSSCRAESVPLDRELAEGVARMLADLGWSGVANVQFVRAPGGRPRIIDLNGRLYGSLALAYATGVNVPDLWARIGLGEAVGELVIGRPGVRFEAFGDDVERARKERRGGLARDLADVAWSSLRAPQWRRALRDPGPATDAVSQRIMQRVPRRRPDN